MEEEFKHNIQKGNGVANDALSEIGDLLVLLNKKTKKLEESNSEGFILQNKNFSWLKISVFIAGFSLIIAIISILI